MAERSLVVRAVWFVFVGWWATIAVVEIAWALNVTVVGLPIGIWLINRVPTVQSLAEPRSLDEGEDPPRQPSIVVRATYFVVVGWWLSFLWANAAAVLSASIVGLPLGFWMFNRLPYVTSLHRFH
jgi:uncharacterized membrane protein YccF (DUF307 family)